MRRIISDAAIAAPNIVSVTIIGLDHRTVISTDPSLMDRTWPSSAQLGAVRMLPGVHEAQRARVVTPMVLDGRMLGHALVMFDAWQIVDSVESYAGLGETGETLLATPTNDGNVTVIAPLRHDRGAAFNRTFALDQVHLPVIDALKYDEIHLSEQIADWRGVPVLAATAHLPYMDWSVVVKIDYEEAIQQAIHLRDQYALMGAGLLLIAGLAGLLAGHFLSAPLKRLVAATERVAAGNLDEEVAVGSRDEVGDFISSFNRMTAELRNAQAIISTSEERYRSVVETSPDAIFIRTEGRIAFCSSAAVKLFGYESREEFIGIDPRATLHPDDLEMMQEVDQSLWENRNAPVATRCRRVRLDGTVFFAEVTKAHILWNDKPAFLVSIRDMTERDRAEAAVRESEERYRQMAELSPDAIMVRDRERIVYANSAAAELFGYPDAASMVGVDPVLTVHPDDREKLSLAATATQEGKAQPMLEFRQIRTDGTIFTTQTRRAAVTWNGKPAMMISARDVTEQNRNARRLLESQQRYRAIAELSPDSILIRTVDKILYCNSAAAEMFAYESAAELMKVHPNDTVDAVDRERLRKVWDEVEADDLKSRISNVTQCRKDGSTFITESRRSIIEWEGEKVLLIVARDITDRIEAESKLTDAYAKLERSNAEVTASESFFRAVIEQAADGIMIIDDRGVIEQVNPMAGDMFGYDADEMIGENIRMIMPPREAAQHDGHLKRYRETGQQKVIGVRREETGMTRDGREIPVEISTAEVSTPDRRRFLGIVRDISERVESERKLKLMNDELQTVNEEMRRFTYIVSHDLKAPLVNIRGFANELMGSFEDVREAFEPVANGGGGLQRIFDEELSEDIPEALEFIDTSVGKMEGMIRSILKLSRVGRHEIMAESVDMAEPAAETVAALGYMIEETGSEVIVGDLPVIQIDRDAISQILGNLVENALKYLSPDRKGRIEINGEISDGFATVAVHDNGRGIAENDIPKIFELFRRVGRNDVAGDGMGLTYTQAFVQRLGGTLTCESELDVGTTFTLRFPQEKKAIAA